MFSHKCNNVSHSPSSNKSHPGWDSKVLPHNTIENVVAGEKDCVKIMLLNL